VAYKVNYETTSTSKSLSITDVFQPPSSYSSLFSSVFSIFFNYGHILNFKDFSAHFFIVSSLSFLSSPNNIKIPFPISDIYSKFTLTPAVKTL